MRCTEVDLAYHGVRVVHDAGLRLEAGTVTALVGPNGSGKSTLLRALARLHRPDARRRPPRRRRPRRSTCPPRSSPAGSPCCRRAGRRRSGVSVRDVVGYGRHPYRGPLAGRRPGRRRARSPGPWRSPASTRWPTARVDELSGGELQRVWLATCLAQDTGVLLLDEPTTFLDLRYQVEILDLVRDLADDHGVAVGVVLHDLNQAAAVADQVVLLDGGRVRAAGTPAEVLTADALTETYGIRIEVATDPATGHLDHPARRPAHHPRPRPA